jgi:oligopeptide transport system permease protein
VKHSKSLLDRSAYYLSLFLLLGSFFSLFVELKQDINLGITEPSWLHLLGTDSLGRDLLLRVFKGSLLSLGVGITTALMALALGVIIGWSVFYFPVFKFTYSLITRMLLMMPSVFWGMITVLFYKSILGDSEISHILSLVLALSTVSWVSISRTTLNMCQLESQKDYILAARALGANEKRVFINHIFPNIFPILLSLWLFQIPHQIVGESVLSFLGFGVNPPLISWGGLMLEGWKSLSVYPHLILGPALFLFTSSWCIMRIAQYFADSRKTNKYTL